MNPSRIAALSAFLLLIIVTHLAPASASGTIDKTQSGLMISDSLTSGNTAGWSFDGSASIHNYYEDQQGLHIGVRSPSPDNWVNYYAGRSQSGATLFHAKVNIADSVVPDGVSNVGIYVEGSDYIPHVGCEAYADSTGRYWVVEQSYDAGQSYNILYITQPNQLPNAQDCTIVTNGDNLLQVYIGGTLVFSSNSMSLGMSAPFIVYFQNDVSSSSSMRYATYSDYYAAKSQLVKITDNPQNAASAKILDSSGNILASAPVSGGIANIDVGKFNYPLSATINVYDSSNQIIATGAASIYGGDTYAYSAPVVTAPLPPTNLAATSASSSQINLSWNAPSDNGGAVIIGYRVERAINGGAFSVLASNTASTSTSYSDTGLAASTSYSYRVSAINSAGASQPSNAASATTNQATANLRINSQDSSSNPIFGYYTELYQGGSLVSFGYTPANFALNSGQSYTIQVTDYSSYKFGHWADTGSTVPSRTISITSDTTLTAVFKTVPLPPTNLAATSASSSQINLSWNAPSDNGGSPITNYKVQRSQDGGSTWPASFDVASTSYSDSGLNSSTTYTYRVLAVNSVGPSAPSGVSSATTQQPAPTTISKISSGLISFDPLDNETKSRAELEASQGFWHYGGSAFSYFNPPAPTELFKDSQGLHLGVQTRNESQYAGFYAVTQPTDAKLFHAVIATPVRTITHEFFQNGLYVQTNNGLINYVTCVSITSQWGTSWHLIRTYGDVNQATSWDVLWSDTSANPPLTRDCTIITNGNNYLKLYMDGNLVYQNNTLNLQMPGPFLYFLEPQNPHMEMLYGIYKDYYALKDETIRVDSLPASATRVDVVSGGNVLSSASVANGTASVDVGRYHFPLLAEIKAYDANNLVVASTVNPLNLYGGDVYSVG